MTQRFFFTAGLAMAALTTQAQAVRYSAQGHLSVSSQPSMGHELPAYLGVGDQVTLVANQPKADPKQHISENMRRQFVYVSYPAYRDQAAGEGWVLRHYLVGTPDSTLLPMADLPAQTWTTTKVVTTKRYVPVTAGKSSKATRVMKPAANSIKAKK